MSFLRNRVVNLVNLHYAFTSLAMAGGGVFFGSYLLRAGVPAPAVLGSLALIVACRFVVRPSVLALGKRFGLKRLLIAGTVGSALQYPLLAEVHGVGRALLALCIIAAIGDTFYWTCYHAYFASVGDPEHRGQQIGAREAFASGMAIAGPLVIGGMLVTVGPRAAFGTTAAIQALAALPLVLTPEVRILSQAPGSFRASLRGASIFAIDGWNSASYVFVWQIALFLSLGESFSRFGAAMALAALVGAVGGLLLGRHIDAGNGHHATWLALGGLTANIIFRAVSTGTPALAVLANAAGALEGCLYQTTLMTAVYNQAKASPCALRFHIATEGAWDVGFGTGCLTAAALLLLGVPLSAAILLSLVGIPPLFGLMRQHFADERDPLAFRVSSEPG
ncbi:MAG TPA: MFS transporter [Vicinamibacterales bacterium]|nr:MFS transporter [Vicinamibacterales bacterium]